MTRSFLSISVAVAARREHPDYETVMLDATTAETGSLVNFNTFLDVIQLFEPGTHFARDVAGWFGRGRRGCRAFNRVRNPCAIWHHARQLDTRVRALPCRVCLLRGKWLSEDTAAEHFAAARRAGRGPLRPWAPRVPRLHAATMAFSWSSVASLMRKPPPEPCCLRALGIPRRGLSCCSGAYDLAAYPAAICQTTVKNSTSACNSPGYAPELRHRYGPRTSIVHSPDFESGCVRVLRGKTHRLMRAEKTTLQPFEAARPADDAVNAEEEDAPESFVERLQKRWRLAQDCVPYERLKSIPPTSNVVERFLSVARVTFGHQWHGLLPLMLETILFLRQNRSYWDATTVDNLR
ncbi:hypothetical protein ON010_g1287 [Phytophthora cinnamomi]|nr:hypothetical protein ON010_g1287 [Phytophthora cinnamomi]